MKDTEDNSSKTGGYRHPGVTLSGEGDVWKAVCRNKIFCYVFITNPHEVWCLELFIFFSSSFSFFSFQEDHLQCCCPRPAAWGPVQCCSGSRPHPACAAGWPLQRRSHWSTLRSPGSPRERTPVEIHIHHGCYTWKLVEEVVHVHEKATVIREVRQDFILLLRKKNPAGDPAP